MTSDFITKRLEEFSNILYKLSNFECNSSYHCKGSIDNHCSVKLSVSCFGEFKIKKCLEELDAFRELMDLDSTKLINNEKEARQIVGLLPSDILTTNLLKKIFGDKVIN